MNPLRRNRKKDIFEEIDTSDGNAKRRPNESFSDYKKRLKARKKDLKIFKKGVMFYQGYGPYVREKRKKLGKSKSI